MKLAKIIAAVEVLRNAKSSRIKDEALRFALISDYLLLRKISSVYEEEQRELLRKFEEEQGSEFKAVQALRAAGKPVIGHDEFLSAESDLGKFIADRILVDKPVDGLQYITTEQLMKVSAEWELTMEGIMVLNEVLVKNEHS